MLLKYLAFIAFSVAHVVATTLFAPGPAAEHHVPLLLSTSETLELRNEGPLPQDIAQSLTNAKRLQLGLPLKPPVRRTRQGTVSCHPRQTKRFLS
jgi:hypothetical protein